MVATLLPICIIITTLTFLNLDKVVFDMMGGLNHETSHDGAYQVLFMLTLISTILALPLLIAYVIAIYKRWKTINRNKAN
jgi:uncharacterized membrane protein